MGLTDEQKEIKKEFAKYKRIVTEIAGEIHDIVEDIDLMEIMNSRSPLPISNNRARAFAAKHGLPGSAGSDAHTVNEIGHSYLDMPDFNDKNEFLEALKQGKIHGKRSGIFVHVFSTWASLKDKLCRGDKHE